jgi:NhaP-type Na+/H+ or K+/H+ antiporter
MSLMNVEQVWFVLVGALFVTMALASSSIARLPLTTSMLYLGVGAAIGPSGLSILNLDPVAHRTILEHITEVAVIVSLFTAGLKLRLPLSDPRWWLPVRLASVTMIATVAGVAASAAILLGLPWGVGVILGAVLAPTDPVLASDVQVAHAFDKSRLRFTLTGEASLNDGSAFPLLMLGLGLVGLHDLGAWGWRWLAVDVFWAVSGGLAVGAILGTIVGRVVLYLRRTHREAVGLDDFLALGLIALAYGVALTIHTYGFLAVFAAGVALRRVERLASNSDRNEVVEAVARVGATADEIATDDAQAPAYMAQAVLTFNEQLERIGEVAVVVITGALLSAGYLAIHALWFVVFLLVLIRPLSVAIGLAGSELPARERLLVGWFGIRGIGSIYYVMWAATHGLASPYLEQVIALTLTTVAASILLHGVTVTPMISRWGQHP